MLTLSHLKTAQSLRHSANRYEAAEAIQHAIFGDSADASFDLQTAEVAAAGGAEEAGEAAGEAAGEDAGEAADDDTVTEASHASSRSETSAAVAYHIAHTSAPRYYHGAAAAYLHT